MLVMGGPPQRDGGPYQVMQRPAFERQDAADNTSPHVPGPPYRVAQKNLRTKQRFVPFVARKHLRAADDWNQKSHCKIEQSSSSAPGPCNAAMCASRSSSAVADDCRLLKYSSMAVCVHVSPPGH